MRTDQEALLHLVQLGGASFPSGAFAHSVGFETLVADGVVADAAALERATRDWLRFSLGPVEGTAVALAHAAAARGPGGDDRLLELDELLGALKPGREAHEASTKTGGALLRTACVALPGPATLRYADAVAAGTAAGHGAIAFAASCADHRVPRDATALGYLQAAVVNLVGVVARLVPLGQLEVQTLLTGMRPALADAADRALAAGVDDLGSALAHLDVASMRHERLYTRLCIS